MSELIERLWEAHASSQQRVLGSDIFAEAATEITRLQEALAAAEAERNSLLDPATVRVNILHGRIAIPDDLVWLHDTNGPVAALLAETRKKALEEAAAHGYHLPIGETRTRGLLKDSLYAAAHAAVPRHLPRWMRDDVISDVVLAVLEGVIEIENVAKCAGKYIAAHYAEFADRKTVSLDAPIPGTDSLTYMDRLAATPTEEAYA